METQYFENDLLHIVAQAARLQREGCRPVVIAIDGMAGSGKSTLTDLLCRRLDAAVVHMDDFFLPQGFRTPERLRKPGWNVCYERFMQEVLPYLHSRVPFAYRIYDAHRHRYNGTRLVPDKPFIIVEGAYAQHPKFGEPYDLRIFCEVSPSEQLRRIQERSPVQFDMFRAFWIPMENRYFDALGIRAQSDIVVTSGPEEAPPPLEIERKFLIAYPDTALLERHSCKPKAEMEQTYLTGTGKTRSVRLRKSTVDGVTRYRRNEKQSLSGMARVELEEDLEADTYRALLEFADPRRRTIHKTRYYVPAGALTAEIDIFPFWTDRAVCEVELPDESNPVTLPDYLTVIREVTDDPRYTNAAMALEVPFDEL